MAQTPDNLNPDDLKSGPYINEYVSEDDPDVIIVANEEGIVGMQGDELLDVEAPATSETLAGTRTDEGTIVYATETLPTEKEIYDRALAAEQDKEGDWQSTNDPGEIRDDIGDTRAQLSLTLNELEERLNPQRLKDQVKDTVQETTQRVSEQAKSTVHDATIGKAEQVVNNVESSAKDAGGTLLDTIKENPIPVALVGVGLGWLIMKTRETAQKEGKSGRGQHWSQRVSGSDYGYAPYNGTGNYDYGNSSNGSSNRISGAMHDVQGRAQDTMHNVQGRAQDTMHNVQGQAQDTMHSVQGRAQEAVGTLQDRASQVQGRASDAISSVQDRASQMTDQVQGTAQQFGSQAQRAESWLERNMTENPLAVGAIAAAVGIAAGLMLPETPPENRFMGPTRDRLVEQAATKAEDAIDKAAGATQKATKAVAGAAGAGQTATKVADKASEGADKVVGKAKDVVEGAKDKLASDTQSSEKASSGTSGR